MESQTIAWPYRAEDFTIFCYVITEAEISVQFILDVKAHARSHRISYHRWLNYMTDLYRDYRGIIVDRKMREIPLDTVKHFEQTPDSIAYWFRDFLMPGPIPSTYLRKESLHRFLILATILKARSPIEAANWGQLKH